MSEGKFDFSKPWSLSTLPPDIRKIAEEAGCEFGNTYLGDPEDSFDEVFSCPFCRTIIFNATELEIGTRCSHLVFIFDIGNHEYDEIDDEFRQHYLSKYCSLNNSQLNENLPVPEDLIDTDPEIEFCEYNDVWGIGGTIWGFWNR